MVPIRTHTALNHIGLAAVSFRLVFTLFNAHSICWRRRWCLLRRDIQVNFPCSDRGAWTVTCVSHCFASFSPSGGMLVGDKCSRIVQVSQNIPLCYWRSLHSTVASTTSHVRCNTMRYDGQLSRADQDMRIAIANGFTRPHCDNYMEQCNAMQCNAMQCNAMQCNAMQCNAMQCNAMQCNAMQCNAMQCNAMQCNAMQCNAMQCNAMQCNAMQCNAMQCNAMQCNAMQCNAMQCNAMQCNAMQCNAMQCNAMQCNAMQCNAMQCNAMQCNAMQCNAMQCNAMQCNAMQCNAMQCNAMQCNAMQCNAMQLNHTLYSIHFVSIFYNVERTYAAYLCDLHTKNIKHNKMPNL